MFDDVLMLCSKIRHGMEAAALSATVVAPTASTELLTRVLVAIESVRRSADAAQLVVIAELARRDLAKGEDGLYAEVRTDPGVVAEMAPDEIEMAIACTAREAHERCRLAVRLADDLDPLVVPLLEGRTTERALRLVAEETEEASPEAVRAVVEHVLEAKRGTDEPRIVALDRHDLAQACRRVLDRVDVGWRQRRAETNRRDRTDVRIEPGPIGTTYLTACLPSELALVLWRAVDELASTRRREEPGLTAGMARAAALTDLALRGVEVSPHVVIGMPVVRCDADVLSGAGSEADAGAGAGREPWLTGVEVPRIGWIPPDVVQTLTERLDTRVSRALLDAETGVVAETSTTGYVPPPAVRRHLQLRDRTCRMWGCDRPAVETDLDHAEPWPAGETSPINLSALCRHHHRVKHAPGWSHLLRSDGTTEWVSPGGVSRVSLPADHLAADGEATSRRPAMTRSVERAPAAADAQVGPARTAVASGADIGPPPF